MMRLCYHCNNPESLLHILESLLYKSRRKATKEGTKGRWKTDIKIEGNGEKKKERKIERTKKNREQKREKRRGTKLKNQKKKQKRQEQKKQKRKKEKKKFVTLHKEGKRNGNDGHLLLPSATWNYHLSTTRTTNVTARLEVSLPSPPSSCPPPSFSFSSSSSFFIVLHVNSGEYLYYLLGHTSSGRDQND